jgi:hypothetical protein
MSWGDRLIGREVDRAKQDVKAEKRQEREAKGRDARRTDQPKDTPRSGK